MALSPIAFNLPKVSDDLLVVDTTTRTTLGTLSPASPVETIYTGPVPAISAQYLNLTKDSLNITAETPSWFIHSGAGDDAIQVEGGTNVIDGGTGSNFLVGGKTGFDTFFIDARGATAETWSTVVNFHSGDNATMWGITPAMFNIVEADNDGAAGFQGLTFHVTTPGKPEVSLTLAGFSTGDLSGPRPGPGAPRNDRLTVSFGTDAPSGSPYMMIHAN